MHQVYTLYVDSSIVRAYGSSRAARKVRHISRSRLQAIPLLPLVYHEVFNAFLDSCLPPLRSVVAIVEVVKTCTVFCNRFEVYAQLSTCAQSLPVLAVQSVLCSRPACINSRPGRQGTPVMQRPSASSKPFHWAPQIPRWGAPHN